MIQSVLILYALQSTRQTHRHMLPDFRFQCPAIQSKKAFCGCSWFAGSFGIMWRKLFGSLWIFGSLKPNTFQLFFA